MMFKKAVLLVLLSTPVSVAFADAAINAKIAATKAQMIRDFSPPKATQYLTAPNTRRTANGMSEGNMPASNAQTPPESNAPSVPSGFENAPSASTGLGSWYVQPGDTSPPASGGSPSSGFNHNTLY